MGVHFSESKNCILLVQNVSSNLMGFNVVLNSPCNRYVSHFLKHVPTVLTLVIIVDCVKTVIILSFHQNAEVKQKLNASEKDKEVLKKIM